MSVHKLQRARCNGQCKTLRNACMDECDATLHAGKHEFVHKVLNDAHSCTHVCTAVSGTDSM